MPPARASACISSASIPYSSTYSALTVSLGSLPGLRAGTNPTPSSRASAAPRMNPRASAATTRSTDRGRASAASSDTAWPSAVASSSRGVMSLKTIPGLGKSGMSRTSALRSTVLTAGLSADDAAQVADQQQMPEVRGHRGEVLECLDRLLAALGIARAQRRGEDALKQLGLAVGRASEHAQVAAADAVAGQLRDGADDLPLGLVVVARPASDVALDHAELDQLTDQRRVGAGLLDDVLERVQRSSVAGGHHRAPQRAAVARGG